MAAWKCPFCNQNATVGYNDKQNEPIDIKISSKYGYTRIRYYVTVCPNPSCKELTLDISLLQRDSSSSAAGGNDRTLLGTWALIPESLARPFPAYIPAPLIVDYKEACLILNGSPKASATLSRRCLQGIIRDLWGISKSRLIDEINELEDKIDPLTWKSIDAVRRIGNIGAHMEKDINTIVDVDPQEAQLLIDLIELLFEEWYITRYEREQKLNKIVAAAEAKK